MSQADPPLVPSLPAHADAALLFVEGGLLWLRREGARHTGGAGHTGGAATRIKALGPQQLRAAVSEVPVDSGWLLDGVKRWGHGPEGAYALIVTAPQTRTLVLQRPGQSRLDTLDVSLPTLAMLGVNRQFYVWALAGAPEPRSRLFYPPLPNVHDDSAVCWGENHPPRTTSPKGVAKALELFLASAFTNAEVDRRSRTQAHDVRVQLLALAGAPYPTDDLVPFRRGETLTKAVDRLTRRTNYDSRFLD